MFIFGVCSRQVSRSCSFRLDSTGAESAGGQLGAGDACPGLVLPGLQSTCSFSEQEHGWCSRGDPQPCWGVASFSGWPSGGGQILSLTDWPRGSVALCLHACRFEVPVGSGVAKNASRCFRPRVCFPYRGRLSWKQKHAPLKARGVAHMES